MKKFSDFLSDYVEQKDITWTEAANLCGVNRTLLSRYASGKKSPDGLDKVQKIAEGLGMSKEQTEEFQFLYQVSKTGEYQYCALRLIEQIFDGNALCFDSEPDLADSEWKEVEETVCCLHGREEIRSAICYFTEEASYLQMHMNFSSLLSGIRFNCRTEQIIEIDHMGSREEEVEEIKMMLPHLYAGQDYKIYCHYRRCEETAELEERVSVLLSDKGLILFTEDLERGICTYEAGYRDYYGQVFADDLKKCHMFAESRCDSKSSAGPQEGEAFLENESSGISFRYGKQPREHIWVRKNGGGQNGFCIEEAQLVKMFLVFMGMQPEEEPDPEEEQE